MKKYNVSMEFYSGHELSTIVESEHEIQAKCKILDFAYDMGFEEKVRVMKAILLEDSDGA